MTDTSFEHADPLATPTPALATRLADLPYRRFAALGDSLSKGTGDPTPGYEPLGWSDRVGRALRLAHPDAAYLNTAVVGVTTGEALAHQTDAVTAFAPDLLHLPSGANDLLVRAPDFDRLESDLRAAHRLAARLGATATVFTFGRAFVVPALNDWGARIRRLNDLVRRLAREHDAVLVDMWDHPVNDRADLVSADRIHFAGVGQAVLATEVVTALVARARLG